MVRRWYLDLRRHLLLLFMQQDGAVLFLLQTSLHLVQDLLQLLLLAGQTHPHLFGLGVQLRLSLQLLLELIPLIHQLEVEDPARVCVGQNSRVQYMQQASVPIAYKLKYWKTSTCGTLRSNIMISFCTVNRVHIQEL